jgi:hypothetical protein
LNESFFASQTSYEYEKNVARDDVLSVASPGTRVDDAARHLCSGLISAPPARYSSGEISFGRLESADMILVLKVPSSNSNAKSNGA